jgi:hypothetical protein
MADNVRRLDCRIVAEHARSNAPLLASRSRDFSILYCGPAGPITL